VLDEIFGFVDFRSGRTHSESALLLYFAIEKCRKMQSKMQKIATLLIPF
jgi:hypothetical protein